MTTDTQFTQMVSSYIMTNLNRACTTPEIEKVISAVAAGVADARNSSVYDSVSQSHVEAAAEAVLKNELNRQLAEYNKVVSEKNWLERLVLTNYFKQYKASIEEYRLAMEDICLKH